MNPAPLLGPPDVEPAPVPADVRMGVLDAVTQDGAIGLFLYVKATRQLLLIAGKPPVKIVGVWDSWKLCPEQGNGSPTHIANVRMQHVPHLWNSAKSFSFYCWPLEEYRKCWIQQLPFQLRVVDTWVASECARLIELFHNGEFTLELRKELEQYITHVHEGDEDPEVDIGEMAAIVGPVLSSTPARRALVAFCHRKAIEHYQAERAGVVQRLGQARAAFRCVTAWQTGTHMPRIEKITGKR